MKWSYVLIVIAEGDGTDPGTRVMFHRFHYMTAAKEAQKFFASFKQFSTTIIKDGPSTDEP